MQMRKGYKSEQLNEQICGRLGNTAMHQHAGKQATGSKLCHFHESGKVDIENEVFDVNLN